jgi:hypothetical protein
LLRGEEVGRAVVPGEDLLPDLGECAEDEVVVARRVERQEPVQQLPQLRPGHDLLLHDHLQHGPPEVRQRVRRLFHHRHALLHAPRAALARRPPVPPAAVVVAALINGSGVVCSSGGLEEPGAALELAELAQQRGQARRALHAAAAAVVGRVGVAGRRRRERGLVPCSPRRLGRGGERRGGDRSGRRHRGGRRGHRRRLLLGAVGDEHGLGAAAHEPAGHLVDAQPAAASARHHRLN